MFRLLQQDAGYHAGIIQKARAEVRFIRATVYYMLLDAFRNVPLDTTQEHPAGYLPEQATAQELFDFAYLS